MVAGKSGSGIDQDFVLTREMFRRKEDYERDPTQAKKDAWTAAIKALEAFRGEVLNDEEK